RRRVRRGLRRGESGAASEAPRRPASAREWQQLALLNHHLHLRQQPLQPPWSFMQTQTAPPSSSPSTSNGPYETLNDAATAAEPMMREARVRWEAQFEPGTR